MPQTRAEIFAPRGASGGAPNMARNPHLPSSWPGRRVEPGRGHSSADRDARRGGRAAPFSALWLIAAVDLVLPRPRGRPGRQDDRMRRARHVQPERDGGGQAGGGGVASAGAMMAGIVMAGAERVGQPDGQFIAAQRRRAARGSAAHPPARPAARLAAQTALPGWIGPASSVSSKVCRRAAKALSSAASDGGSAGVAADHPAGALTAPPWQDEQDAGLRRRRAGAGDGERVQQMQPAACARHPPAPSGQARPAANSRTSWPPLGRHARSRDAERALPARSRSDCRSGRCVPLRRHAKHHRGFVLLDDRRPVRWRRRRGGSGHKPGSPR